MPKLEEVLIDRLTLRPEVREKARSLLHAVHSKTGPGTGYDIGEAKTGLPAICAFIASKALGYADIAEDVAQKASCLAPKTFKSTLKTVKTALLASKTPNASPSKPGNEIDPTAYATLIDEYKIGQPLRVESWMKEAQAALTALPRFREDFASRLSESGPEIRIAVFFWVCRAIKLSAVQHVSLVDKYGVSLKVFSRLVKAIEDECVELKESIRTTIKEMRKKKANMTTDAASSKSTPMSTPSRSQSQPQSRSASPTKSALRTTSNQTPSRASGSAKRKVAFSFSLSDASVSASEDDHDSVFAPETPSKRPRTTTTPRRPAAAASRTLPVRRASSGSVVPASVSSEEDAEDVEMLDAPPLLTSTSTPTPTPRRLVASEPVAGPSTPRRRSSARAPPATPTTHAYRTPPSARTQMLFALSADEEEEADGVAEEGEDAEALPATAPAEEVDDADVGNGEDALPLSRRFRPVFLDRAQWAQRAPRLARDRAAAERRTRELIARWGPPFELLRHDATSHV